MSSVCDGVIAELTRPCSSAASTALSSRLSSDLAHFGGRQGQWFGDAVVPVKSNALALDIGQQQRVHVIDVVRVSAWLSSRASTRSAPTVSRICVSPRSSSDIVRSTKAAHRRVGACRC